MASSGARFQGLAEQHLDTLDVSTLTPLSPEVISRQATINIGTIGHVAHGKSTIVKALSGKSTIKFKAEFSRNITIKLGYANAKIFKSVEPLESTGEYLFETAGSGHDDEYVSEVHGVRMQLVRHISFVDCPGHDILMATMLNGAAVMDAAMLLIAANEPCPQPQTSEHLAAVEIMQLANILILQNKVDLVQQEDAAEQYNVIKNFVAGTVAGKAPVLPVSAQLGYNVDMVARFIYSRVPVPVRRFDATPRMIVIRSFDVNKPGECVEKLCGGVAGGSITQGVLRHGDAIEIRPGIITKDGKCTPITSTIVSLYAEKNELQYAVPGGLIGVGTNIDPTLTRADRLVGQVLGLRGELPEVYKEVDVKYHLLRRLLGQRAESGGKQARVSKLAKGESLMVNIGSTSTGATVISTKSDTVRLALIQPVCTELHEKIALSRSVDKHWRLIGWGTIRSGKTVELQHMD